MKINYLINEVSIGNDEKLEQNFNFALGLVFNFNYLKKINEFVNKKVKIVEAENKNGNIVAWNIGTTIYVNKQIFYAKAKSDQIRFLLHEFMHVLMNKRSFFIKKQFQELQDLSDKLYKIVKANLEKPIEVFLTGQKQAIPTIDQQEIVSYLMNGKIDWSALSLKGRKEFIRALKESNIFNLQSNFWKKRLA
jgi:hypothetical protein